MGAYTSKHPGYRIYLWARGSNTRSFHDGQGLFLSCDCAIRVLSMERASIEKVVARQV